MLKDLVIVKFSNEGSSHQNLLRRLHGLISLIFVTNVLVRGVKGYKLLQVYVCRGTGPGIILVVGGANTCCLEDVLVFFTGADRVPHWVLTRIVVSLSFMIQQQNRPPQALLTWSFAFLLVMEKITHLLKDFMLWITE